MESVRSVGNIRCVSQFLVGIMGGLGPRPALLLEEELFLILAGELRLRLASVLLGQVLLHQEVVDAQLLPIRVAVDPAQNASVFIEVSRLDLDYFSFNHGGDDFLDLFAELLGLPLPALGGVDAVEADDELGGVSVEPDDDLDGVAVGDFHHLGEEDLVVEGELLRVLDFEEGVVLFLAHRLLDVLVVDLLGRCLMLGSLHHLLLVQPDRSLLAAAVGLLVLVGGI